MKHVLKNLYKSKAPTCVEDLIDWRIAGITQVICLQEGWSWLGGAFQAEKLWESSGGSYHKQSFSNFFPPNHDELEALACMIDAQPTLVHCKAGVDRTGMLCGYYLATRTDRPIQDCWDYAKKEGMHFWYQIGWKKAFFKAVLEQGKR
ncbi:MAG: dual specificity protein phosphatase family protein [Nitrosomonas sp.]|nr:dual specificity protein phosphatase family protein [Nitrosomonas sp.]